MEPNEENLGVQKRFSHTRPGPGLSTIVCWVGESEMGAGVSWAVKWKEGGVASFAQICNVLCAFRKTPSHSGFLQNVVLSTARLSLQGCHKDWWKKGWKGNNRQRETSIMLQFRRESEDTPVQESMILGKSHHSGSETSHLQDEYGPTHL